MRIFTAIEIPEEIKGRIASIAPEFDIDGVTLVRKAQLHITLHFLGEMADDRIEPLESAISTHKFSRFEVNLKGLSCFSPTKPRIIFVGIGKNADKISSVYLALAGTLVKGGFYPMRNPYVPHATIARVKGSADSGTLIRLIKKYSTYDFGTYEVSSLSLKKSTLTGSGPVYEELYKLEF